MLGLPLWGVLDISQMERKYEIQEVIDIMMFNDQFKDDGFKVMLIDHNNFIQKLPYFSDNNEFLDKHNLYFNNTCSYPAYLKYMHDLVKQYNNEIQL